ncbi:mandelate racemase/muconate lactonizing enzyme family protein [Ramlibacter sp. AW1]|uniref:Mandelate racemase/muconate lactonizing enzyme family protein n=1 Tax=Ramlibacter aurantiacus TaxID=2801330 RepID=A0A937D5Y7_9BURK|nr:mandelate racemase/muconate lactonizing enzyme family protein [Ramlibacter aurantiacus]MBL0421792.1 mandelate racemase/muconate lactonizing enzyme family protein [Ramlibacter aurantiacus]
MKIVKAECLHADGGLRVCSYLKVSTDEGLVGWSEYYDSFSPARLDPVIQDLARTAIGMDPRQVGRISETLLATTRLASGGLAQQAVAAIENACLDIAGKAAGLPVHVLLGGPLRDRVPVYWTHCGSYRVARESFFTGQLGLPPIRSMDDLVGVAREAVAQGYRAVKTNPVFFENGKPHFFNGGFRVAPGFLDRSMTDRQLGQLHEQMSAYREAVGPDVGLMLDLSFSQRTEGALRIARRLEPLQLAWLEFDTPDAQALAHIRQNARVPIASLESLHGIHEYRPFLAAQTVDTCIIDPMWNGVWQSARIAAFADAFETTMAPHNPVGDLGSLMSVHLCAAAGNLRMMELRVDEAPWIRSFLTHPPQVVGGEMLVPQTPGWGTGIDEDALRAHPVKPA